jgi:hypothetical protein
MKQAHGLFNNQFNDLSQFKDKELYITEKEEESASPLRIVDHANDVGR